MNLLMIEDEPKIVEVLRAYFEREGSSCDVLQEGTHAVETIRDTSPDCVLLDWMLPGKDGLTICKEVRAFSDVPIIMLTARVEEIDRLLGLELGADDYVCKPFSPREVVLRVRKLVERRRRSEAHLEKNLEGVTSQAHTPQPPQEEGVLSYGPIQLQEPLMRCEVHGEPVALTPVEFRLLHAMIATPRRIFRREELMGFAYDDQRSVSERTIDSHMRNVRKKIQAAGGEDPICSVYGVGYRLD